ncbi:MAG: hypothetical protein QXS41_03480 [Candidatus Woesearchaeota archaeon]
MHTYITNIEENPAIGLFAFANDKFCLVKRGIKESLLKKFEEVLKVPCYEIKVMDSDLIGVFLAGNNDFLISPNLNEEELSSLKEICEKHKVKLILSNAVQNAFGNNIIVSNSKIIVNQDYSEDEIKFLSKETNLEVVKIKTEITAIGSLIKLNSKGGICGTYKEEFEKLLNLKLEQGTVLHGSIFVSIGIIANSNGFISSRNNTGIEIAQIDEALGFVNL